LDLTVADMGIGIPPDQLNPIGEPFHQVDASLARRHEGSGLGLSISQHLTALHDGTLSIESQVRQGTTVTLRLPPHNILREPDLESAIAGQRAE